MPTTFSHAAATLIFARNPKRPQWSMRILQPRAETAAGVPVGYDIGAVERLIILHWPAMAAADVTALLAFWRHIAAGSANTFEMTSADGTINTVRFAPGNIPMTEKTQDSTEVTVRLIIVP